MVKAYSTSFDDLVKSDYNCNIEFRAESGFDDNNKSNKHPESRLRGSLSFWSSFFQKACGVWGKAPRF